MARKRAVRSAGLKAKVALAAVLGSSQSQYWQTTMQPEQQSQLQLQQPIEHSQQRLESLLSKRDAFQAPLPHPSIRPAGRTMLNVGIAGIGFMGIKPS